MQSLETQEPNQLFSHYDNAQPLYQHKQPVGEMARYENPTRRPLLHNPYELVDWRNELTQLAHFLETAPTGWMSHEVIRQFQLPTGDYISCVLHNKLFYVTGTDIVRIMVFRFQAASRPVRNNKKFEEGIFSDLRNLKVPDQATLEQARSKFLVWLHQHNCVRTQKLQKVFFWFAVPWDQLFKDALARDLKREKLETEPSTIDIDPARTMWEATEMAMQNQVAPPAPLKNRNKRLLSNSTSLAKLWPAPASLPEKSNHSSLDMLMHAHMATSAPVDSSYSHLEQHQYQHSNLGSTGLVPSPASSPMQHAMLNMMPSMGVSHPPVSNHSNYYNESNYKDNNNNYNYGNHIGEFTTFESQQQQYAATPPPESYVPWQNVDIDVSRTSSIAHSPAISYASPQLGPIRTKSQLHVSQPEPAMKRQKSTILSKSFSKKLAVSKNAIDFYANLPILSNLSNESGNGYMSDSGYGSDHSISNITSRALLNSDNRLYPIADNDQFFDDPENDDDNAQRQGTTDEYQLEAASEYMNSFVPSHVRPVSPPSNSLHFGETANPSAWPELDMLH